MSFLQGQTSEKKLKRYNFKLFINLFEVSLFLKFPIIFLIKNFSLHFYFSFHPYIST